jgi:hypothetical protein
MKWTTEWPKTEGLHWFYGWAFGNKENKPKFDLVNVISNGRGNFIYIRDGHFFYKEEGAIGKFLPVELPELPEDYS